jgi:hypothetical protein
MLALAGKISGGMCGSKPAELLGMAATAYRGCRARD